MTWKREGKYAWTQDDYTISASRINGGFKYTLWKGREPAKMIAIRDKADELKKMVEEAVNG